MGTNVTIGSGPGAGHHQYNQSIDSDEDEDSSKDGSLKESAGDDLGNGNADAEGVWSQDIEQSFQEALAIYPPCGRRKIILSDEGKMYGRNELIARYIKLRTGKTRTRKQVSSHIQVLARRKAREVQSKIKGVKNSSSGPMVASSLGQAQLGPSAGLGSNIVGHGSDGNTTGHHAAQLAAASLAAAHHHHSQSAVVAAAAAHVHHSAATAAGHPHPHLSHVATAAAGLAALGIAAPTSYTPSQFWPPVGPTSEDIKQFCSDGKNFNGNATSNNNNNNNNNTATNYANNSTSSTNGNSNSNLNNNNNGSSNNNKNAALLNGNSILAWEGRSIASPKCRLIEFSAYADTGPNSTNRHLFVQIGPYDSSLSNSTASTCYPLDLPLLEDIDIRQISDKFPSNKDGLKDLYEKGPPSAFFLVKFWADLNIPQVIFDDPFYGVNMVLEASESSVLTCTTSVCSFGKQVVQRVDTIECCTIPATNNTSPRSNSNNTNSNTNSIFNNGTNGGGGGNGGSCGGTGQRYIYRLDRSQMCEYMVNFILKLKDLPEKYMMNSVLENFTILQVISNKETGETLLCIAFAFEVSVSDNGAQHHTYRLVRHN